MRLRRNQNLIWLFSFADLAFLLLIAFTQASTIGKKPISIGEMMLPKVVDGPNVDRLSPSFKLHQIRVHKPDDGETPVFQLVAVDADGQEIPGDRITADRLAERLMAMKANGMAKPVLVPDEISLSKDMLLAMSLIEKTWADVRKVTVERMQTLEDR
ncbi:MAG: hypothetical protein SWH61_16485 [Thermodesulfobacteriota bacterium]|nr:hypothetical protein [Thermodesulfobacteriota bacterium]